MTGGSLGLRTGSYASLHQQLQNGALQNSGASLLVHKPSKTNLSSSRERERVMPLFCRYFGRRRVAMLLLFILALLVFVFGSFAVSRDSSDLKPPYEETTLRDLINPAVPRTENFKDIITSTHGNLIGRTENLSLLPPFPHSNRSLISNFFPRHSLSSPHPCKNFALPPPAPANGKRTGARPCPVCYIPVEQAIASMPISPSISPVLRSLTYIHDENPIKSEPHGGSDFGGYPSLRQRNDSFNIKESMTVHCGFVKGSKPGNQSGFDIDEADLLELEEFHEVIVASAIFGNYDVLQQPINISEESKRFVPFYMFIDEETEAYMKNSSLLDSRKRIGLWRIIVVRNVPYADSRRNGKIPKLLLHRLFPNIQYSIWIDGKLQLVVDPFQILERFLWRQNATFAISRHYKRFDVFEEADANKAAGKYDNSSIDEQIDFYVSEGLTPYSLAKLPITSDVPEGCVLIREHVPITNLFTCLWFNEVDRFTSRDQLSFSMVRDKIMSKVNWSINMFLDCERRNFGGHSPFKHLVNRYENKLVIAVGKGEPAAVMSEYGFRNVLSIDEYASFFDNIDPLAPYKKWTTIKGANHEKTIADITEKKKICSERVEAAFIVSDSVDWSRDIQVLCDILRTGGLPGREFAHQPNLYFAHDDLEYQAAFPCERFGMGAFRIALESIYNRIHPHALLYTCYGKPNPLVFHNAEAVLKLVSSIHQNKGAANTETHHFKTVYMIGDNPSVDINGAIQAGSPWFSILTRTGVFKGRENHDKYPADLVVDTVEEAVDYIFKKEGIS